MLSLCTVFYGTVNTEVAVESTVSPEKLRFLKYVAASTAWFKSPLNPRLGLYSFNHNSEQERPRNYELVRDRGKI